MSNKLVDNAQLVISGKQGSGHNSILVNLAVQDNDGLLLVRDGSRLDALKKLYPELTNRAYTVRDLIFAFDRHFPQVRVYVEDADTLYPFQQEHILHRRLWRIKAATTTVR